MRRRLSLGLLVSLLFAALAMPATVAAGSGYTYAIVINECVNNAPGSELPWIKTRLTKPAGWYSATRFTMTSQLQHRMEGERWRNEGQPSTFTKQVPYQHAKFSWSRGFYYEPSSLDYHRIVVKLRVWEGTTLLGESTVRSVACWIQ